MTKAERKMMERIYAYGIILSLDEDRAGLVLARITEMLTEQDAEAKSLNFCPSCAKNVRQEIASRTNKPRKRP